MMAEDPRTLRRGEAGYPARLEDLADPPSHLYALGAVPEGPAVAIIGARAANSEGRRFASTLASELAEQGVTIVSGGARGIDQAAHFGALEARGRTVVVLGCGLGVDYPKGTGELRARAAERGAVLTELEHDAPPRPHNFPRRNRLVAALADAVVVVQAGARSGTMSTVRRARNLGRPVLAVPGAPGAALTRGTHELLRHGAGLAESTGDVLAAIGRGVLPPRVETPGWAPTGALAGLPAALHESLGQGCVSPDELARTVDRPVAEVLTALVDLELRGLVRSRGGCYERT